MAQSYLYRQFNLFLERHLPEGLYARALIIIVAPMVLLQGIMTAIILDRHLEDVTKVLARSLAADISLLVELYEDSDRSDVAAAKIEDLGNRRLALGLTIQRGAELPPPLPLPLFSLGGERLRRELSVATGKPFWIDSRSHTGRIEIRVEAEPGVVFRLLTREDRAFSTSTGVLLFWMVISSLALLGIAIIFLRNQIRPITDLSKAAQDFGTGRDTGAFRPRGAREVRQAGEAFLDMRDRIARQVEQRTAMLAGVSHDIRTVLTRFKLELAFLGNGPKVAPLKEDVDEMQRMLEAYMAFVRGDGGESAEPADLAALVTASARTAERSGRNIVVDVPQAVTVRVKPNAFRRLLANLVGNAARYAQGVWITAQVDGRSLTITIDDDGPGVPADKRAEAFRPFVRLDNARNLDETGTGLGLAIALDIARAHGGDIRLADSPRGGLRAIVEVPV